MVKHDKTKGLPYTYYINRPLADLILPLFDRMTPNQVTTIGFVLFIVSMVILLFSFGGSNNWVFVSYFLLFFSYVLDSVDGRLARKRNLQSKLGEWLDHSLDGLRLLIINAVFITLLLPNIDVSNILLLGGVFLTIICQTANYIFSSLKEHILSQKIGNVLEQGKGSFHVELLRWFALPADFGIFIMLTLFSNSPNIFLFLYINYGVFYFLILLSTTYFTFKQNQN